MKQILDLIFDTIGKLEMLLIAVVSLVISVALYAIQGSPIFQNMLGAFLAFIIVVFVIGLVWGLFKLFSGMGRD